MQIHRLRQTCSKQIHKEVAMLMASGEIRGPFFHLEKFQCKRKKLSAGNGDLRWLLQNDFGIKAAKRLTGMSGVVTHYKLGFIQSNFRVANSRRVWTMNTDTKRPANGRM